MVSLTQMVPCLHVYPWTRALANREVASYIRGPRGVSAKSAASWSEGKKRGPYNSNSYSVFYACNRHREQDPLLKNIFKFCVKIFSWVPLTHELKINHMNIFNMKISQITVHSDRHTYKCTQYRPTDLVVFWWFIFYFSENMKCIDHFKYNERKYIPETK